MSKKLKDKVAIVTGASKGIGAGIAKHLAGEGAKVVVNYASSLKDADRVVDEIKKAGGQAVAIQANLTEPADVSRLFSETAKAYGQLDILVNNAGIYTFAPLEKITPEHFYTLFDLNVLGLVLTCQEALKYFGPLGGSIVNIGSVAGTSPVANFSIYSATKAAVDCITKCLATELGPRKIRVNSVNPGMVQTEGTKAQNIDESDFRKQTEAQTPLGRIGQPSDIAPAVAFLASDEASWITGETLYISGGLR